MKIGVMGLGKMGFALCENLHRNNYDVVGYDIVQENINRLQEKKINAKSSLKDFFDFFGERKIIFLMLPSGAVIDKAIKEISPFLQADDIVVDFGNSNFHDTVRREKQLAEHNIHFLDCGISGGPSGALNGACTMIGGAKGIYLQLEKVFTDISQENGSLYVGESGSGHFVKMVHNGIEYGMMQSLAEGYEIMQRSHYNIDLKKISDLWNNGSVIRGWLLELLSDAFAKDANLDKLKGVMNASGEAKWTVETALQMEVPAPVIALSLMMRNRSLQEDTFSGKVVAALRNEFGGHEVVEK